MKQRETLSRADIDNKYISYSDPWSDPVSPRVQNFWYNTHIQCFFSWAQKCQLLCDGEGRGEDHAPDVMRISCFLIRSHLQVILLNGKKH